MRRCAGGASFAQRGGSAAYAPTDAPYAVGAESCATGALRPQRQREQEEVTMSDAQTPNRSTGFQPVPEARAIARSSARLEPRPHGLETRDTDAQNEPTAAQLAGGECAKRSHGSAQAWDTARLRHMQNEPTAEV